MRAIRCPAPLLHFPSRSSPCVAAPGRSRSRPSSPDPSSPLAGAAANEFTESEHFTKFADLDGGNPLALALGSNQAANAINAKRNALATTVQVVVRRRIAELSF